MATSTVDRADAVRDAAKDAFGFVPNLIDKLASENPAVAETYLKANGHLSNGVLSPAEQQLVILTISGYNDCHYCTKAHGAAGAQAGLDADVIDELVDGGLPSEGRQRLLARATKRILGKRGWLSDDDRAEFEEAGLTTAELYEIVGLIGVKTISNYVNHLAGTPVDPQFQ
jgi:uncharacterized peroxidase-related enzyme